MHLLLSSIVSIIFCCCQESTKKCRESIGRPKYGEDTQLLQMTLEDETSVDLGEFCYVMKEAQKKMPEEVRTVIKEVRCAEFRML